MDFVYNAHIYTLDPNHPTASALAIENGRIVWVGDNDQVSQRNRPDGSTWDAGGQPIIPGLTDAHIHLENYALGLDKVDCETSTRDKCLDRVAERALSVPNGEWILGHGWNQNDWPGGFGSAADLDVVAPHNPVYLTAKSMHAGWANTAALRAADITPQTTDPVDGRIVHDENGEPSGILYEGAMRLLSNAIPVPTISQVVEAISNVQPKLWQIGLTGLHDFDQARCFAALQILKEGGALRLRVVKGIPLEGLSHAVKLGLRTGFGDDFLRIGSIKAFADGALGPHTAAMFQPYEGELTNKGMLMLDAEELYEHGRLAVQNGLSMAVHAIGDLANHEVLNAFDQLRKYEAANGLPPMRHRIEHLQLIHPEDAPRLAELGIIASMQPIHATSDMLMADRYWGARAALSYAWRTQLDHGAVLAFGSDAPVESPNPFWGLHAAITRRRQDGRPGAQGWHSAQRLKITEALQAYTTGPAYAAGMELSLGKLMPGFLADLLILDKDPFTCDPEDLYNIKPLATMIGGDCVWEA
jgi:predicted amidohydrolase YtcJ